MSRLEVSKLTGPTSTLGQVSISAGNTLNIEGALDLNHSGAYTLPSGDTATRPTPSASEVGVVRFNTDTASLEIWSGTEWVVQASSNVPNQSATAAVPKDGTSPFRAGYAASEVTSLESASSPTQRWIRPASGTEPFQIYVADDIAALGNIPSGGPSWVSNVSGLNIIQRSVINQTNTMLITITQYNELVQRLMDGQTQTPYFYWTVWDTSTDNLIGITRTWFTNCNFREWLDTHTGENPAKISANGGSVVSHWDVWGTTGLPSGTAYTISDDTSNHVRSIPYRANSDYTQGGNYSSSTSYGLFYKREGNGEHYPWTDTSDVNTSEGYFQPSTTNSFYGFTGTGGGIHHYIFIAEN